MGLLSGITDFFGLDIGTTAIRAVQLKPAGQQRSLLHYGAIAVDPKWVLSDGNAERQKLAGAIKELIEKSGITTMNAAVGLSSNKVFTTVVDIDKLESSEMAQTIKYQADSLIPTPLAESKIDWAMIGPSPVDKQKIEVLLTSATNSYIEDRLELIEALGLNVIAFEPDAIALTRALVTAGASGAEIVLDIGSKTSDLVIVLGGTPRLVRTLPTGTEAIVRAAAQNLSIDEKQAEQFVFKFGLGKDKLEGQVYNAIISTVDMVVGEIEKSIKFFNTRYQGVKIERVIVTGAASTLPELPLYVANKFGLSVEIGNAWRNVTFPSSMQNELLAVSNHFGVAAGLAERTE